MIKSASFAVALTVAGLSSAAAATFTYDVSNAVVDETIKSGSGSHSIILNNDRYTFQDGATFVYDDVSGAANLSGLALLDGVGFSVDLDLNAIDWGDIPTGGSAPAEPKQEINLDGTGIDPLTDWQAFEYVTGSLTVFGAVTIDSRQSPDGPLESFVFADGDVLDIFTRPPSGQFTWQIGEGASGKNLNFGMSGWFGVTDAAGTSYCAGDYNVCDFNVDLDLDAEVPLPMGAALLPAGLALLWGLRRRQRQQGV